MPKNGKFGEHLQLKKDATVNEFSAWSMRHEALATQEKFKEIMLGKETKPTPVDPTAPSDDEIKALEDFTRKKNNGHSHLLLLVTKEKDT